MGRRRPQGHAADRPVPAGRLANRPPSRAGRIRPGTSPAGSWRARRSRSVGEEIMVKITKETLRDGSVRWRARGVSVGRDPATGRRVQRTITGRTKHEVEAEVRKIGTAVDQHTYRRPWDGTVPELIDGYLANGADDWEDNTRLSYRNALLPAREHFAGKKARSVVREDIEEYKSHLRTAGRRRGGKA